MATKTRLYSFSRQRRTTVWSKNHNVDSDDIVLNTYQANDEVTTGDNYSNYKQLIRAGQNATTSLTGSKWHMTAKPTEVRGVTIEYGSPYPDTQPGFFVEYRDSASITFANYGYDLNEIVKADNQAKLKFISAIRALQTTMSGGVFLGELRQTLRALKHPAQSLRNGLDSYFGDLQKRRRGVRGSPASRRQKLRAIAGNTWLEYAFGWSPLVNDIDDAMHALADHVNGTDGPVSKMVRGTGKSTPTHPSAPFETTEGGSGVYVTFRNTYTFEYAVKYYGRVDVEHPTALTAQRLGLSLDHFVPTAWELVPWSFLVDYFTNIGGMLEAASTCLSGLRWSARTDVQSEVGLSTAINAYSGKILYNGVFVDKMSIRFSPGYGRTEKRLVQRATYLGSFIPRLEFKIPGFGKKWINLAALGASHNRLRPYY